MPETLKAKAGSDYLDGGADDDLIFGGQGSAFISSRI
jgi:Ca2+-binding RTX toxin-like protein